MHTVSHISTDSLKKAKGNNKGLTSTRQGRKMHQSSRQVILTIAGTTLIGLAIVAAIVLYDVTEEKISTSLDVTAKLYRDSVMGEVVEEVAFVLIPIYRSVLRWRSRVLEGGDWPPSAAVFQNDTALLRRFAPMLHTELDADTHVRFVTPDGLFKVHQGFIATGAVLALQTDLITPATNLEECGGVGIVQLQQDYLGSISIAYQHVVEGHIRSDDFRYEPATASVIFPAQHQLPVMSCQTAMEPVWGAPQVAPAFGGWSWFLSEPEKLEISGNLPIRSADGSQIIGRMFSTVELTGLRDNGHQLLNSPWTQGGAFLLYTPSGQVLGDSENPESTPHVHALPSTGLLRRGISELEARLGQMCPFSSQQINTEDGRLIDFAPFFAEEFGMPTMPDGRWCVLMSLPRRNLYGEMDDASEQAVYSGIGVIVAQFFATTLLALAVFFGLKIIRGMQSERRKGHFQKVQSAVKDVKLLNCPMALVSAETFLLMQRLEPHETLRDRGCLKILDSLEGPRGIRKYQEDHVIVFFSHQWVGDNFPDSDDALQLEAMKSAVRTLEKKHATSGKRISVWLDYVSIAQHHPKMMMAAVSSLPVYASIADAFIIVAPPVVHATFGTQCNLETYSMRGWCRAEMLAKACGSGLRDFYTLADSSGELTAINDLAQFSLNVFEGNFTVATDKENLVQPVLGLYSLVLKAVTKPAQGSGHMHSILEHILKDKEAFFPRVYTNPVGEQVELFGPCVGLLEAAMEGLGS